MLTKAETGVYAIPISESLSLLLYSDTRPHHRYIAGLQKGLIFAYQGAELVGEGTGFGVPVVHYRDKTYFSGSSTVQIFQEGNCAIASKQFALDMISQKRFIRTKIENKIIRKLSLHTAELYQKHRHWRLLKLKKLSNSLGLQTSFVQVTPIGNVTVTYRFNYPFIHVKADFKSLKKDGLQKNFLLNEQGATYFSKYCDSNCMVLFDKQIGAWDKVEADWACISDKHGKVGFRLWKVKDTILRRGREFLEGTIDWVGLDYEINLEKPNFEYDIEIFGSQKQK